MESMIVMVLVVVTTRVMARVRLPMSCVPRAILADLPTAISNLAVVDESMSEESSSDSDDDISIPANGNASPRARHPDECVAAVAVTCTCGPCRCRRSYLWCHETWLVLRPARFASYLSDNSQRALAHMTASPGSQAHGCADADLHQAPRGTVGVRLGEAGLLALGPSRSAISRLPSLTGI